MQAGDAVGPREVYLFGFGVINLDVGNSMPPGNDENELRMVYANLATADEVDLERPKGTRIQEIEERLQFHRMKYRLGGKAVQGRGAFL